MGTHRVLVNKAEAARLNKRPRVFGVLVNREPHGLVSLNDEQMRTLRRVSGRRAGVKVTYRGRVYRAFPPTPRTFLHTKSSLERIRDAAKELRAPHFADRAQGKAALVTSLQENLDVLGELQQKLRVLMRTEGRTGRDRSNSDDTVADLDDYLPTDFDLAESRTLLANALTDSIDYWKREFEYAKEISLRALESTGRTDLVGPTTDFFDGVLEDIEAVRGDLDTIDFRRGRNTSREERGFIRTYMGWRA